MLLACSLVWVWTWVVGGTEKFKNEGFLSFQEQGNEKTNNGTHYKLQLLYSNGKWALRAGTAELLWLPLTVLGR